MTRALQSSMFQNPGDGSPERHKGPRTDGWKFLCLILDGTIIMMNTEWDQTPAQAKAQAQCSNVFQQNNFSIFYLVEKKKKDNMNLLIETITNGKITAKCSV